MAVLDQAQLGGITYDLQDTKAQAMIAPAFSAAQAYSTGDSVTYNGTLYTFTADHAAGAWIGTDAATVPGGVTGEVADLKSAVDQSIYIGDEAIGEVVYGYWSNGVFTSSASPLGRKYPLSEGTKKIRVTGMIPKYYDYYDFLDENGDVISYKRKTAETGDSDETTDDIPVNAVYVGVSSNTSANAQRLKLYEYEYINGVVEDLAEQVQANNSSIIELSGIEIEGYEKSQYADVTSQATLNEGKYAEMYQGNVREATGSSYKYCVLSVSPGEIYKTTGVNVFDMRPLIYTDENDGVLAYLPGTRVTTAEIVTVELTAPAGAAKLYVNSTASGELKILKKGYYFVSESDAETPNINVTINKANTLDTAVETRRGNVFRQKFEVYNNVDQPNSAVLPRSCEVYIDGAWKTIENNEDDNCPVELTSGYIGAGHGYDRAIALNVPNHDKTYADIGSKWNAGGNDDCWLVRILDANTLIFMGRNNGLYDTLPFAATTLTHVSGAVHTDTIVAVESQVGSETIPANKQYLITPVDKNHVKKVLLDGITEISENGEYNASQFVDIIDEYDVINPQTIVSTIIANKPVGGYTENPAINTGSTFLHFSNVYRVLSDGTMLLFTTLDNNMNVRVNYWGGTQFAQKASANTFGGGVFAYIPKLLEINSKDMRVPQNLANWNTDIDATTTYWEDANNPPDRILHLYTDGNSKFAAGYAVGYLPVAMGAANVRKDAVNNALTFYHSKKAYPHLIDKKNLSAYDWSAYTPFQSICYRKPVMDVANGHTDAYFVPCGEKCYLYADYHASADDRIKVPAEYIGKPIIIVEKSTNAVVYGAIATDEIRIRVTMESQDVYGYAVVCIG